MSDIRGLTRRWFEEVWNQGRAETIDELLAPEGVMHGLAEAGAAANGPAAFRRFHAKFRSAFPDMRATVEDVIVEGDQVCARVTFTGTHLGEGVGLAPTGRRFTATALTVGRWASGQMVEAWNEFDAAGMVRQLTAAEPQASLRL